MSEVSKLLKTMRTSLSDYNLNLTNKIFIAKQITNLDRNILFPTQKLNQVSSKIISKLRISNSPNEADFILVPHNWHWIRYNSEYLNYLKTLSGVTPIIMVNTGDASPKCDFPNTIQLRFFLHPGEEKYNKIIVPVPTAPRKFRIRDWSTKPSISFMGYVPSLTPGSILANNLRGLKRPIKNSPFLNRKIGTKKLQLLGRQYNVDVTIRKNYSLLKSNPNFKELDLEFQNSLDTSDYILCPRGFGNYSIRFYESLSAGATPILIESDSDFPVISLKSFWENNIVRVGLFQDWKKLINEDWDNLKNGNNYRKRQELNSKIFKEELAFDNFLDKLFDNYLNI
jgi:hypothetical protein